MAKNSLNIMFIMIKNNLNIVLLFIIVLLLIILANIYRSCKSNIKENFEDVTMKPAKKNSVLTDEEIKKIVDTVTNENDTQNIIEKVKAHVNNKEDETDKSEDEKVKEEDKETKEVKEDIVLTKKETELFNAIKKDKINNDELDRLVKSGVVNEDMIMRFLQKMEDGDDKEEVVEEFTSCGMYEGFSSCARDYATF